MKQNSFDRKEFGNANNILGLKYKKKFYLSPKKTKNNEYVQKTYYELKFGEKFELKKQQNEVMKIRK